MLEPLWKTWNELRQVGQNKRIILFGRSEDWVARTIVRLPHAADYIVDSNPGYTGGVFHGLEVRHADTLTEETKEEIYVVITGGMYESIVPQLEGYGFLPGQHFCITPEYRDFRLLKEMRDYEQRLLISSPDYDDPSSKRHSKAGGGLFLYDLGPNETTRVVSGHFRQVIKSKDYIYAVEFVEMRLYVLSYDMQIVDKILIDMPNACGLAPCPERKVLFMANAATDRITVHDQETFQVLDKVDFSNKYRKSGSGQHHINDLCVVDNSLYVSYFSSSGNWKRGIPDGGISEYDIDELGAPPQTLVRDLWMPHSVSFLDGNLCYLDSMRGRFHISNQTIAGEFPGFVRGLDYDGRYYYIGQSEDMYMSRLFGVSNNIMLNAGFYLFDIDTKASRFHIMTDFMNIHDLLVV